MLTNFNHVIIIFILSSRQFRVLNFEIMLSYPRLMLHVVKNSSNKDKAVCFLWIFSIFYYFEWKDISYSHFILFSVRVLILAWRVTGAVGSIITSLLKKKNPRKYKKKHKEFVHECSFNLFKIYTHLCYK